MAHPQPRTHILLPAQISIQLFADVTVLVVQVVKDVGSAQTPAVMLSVVVCARTRLAAPKAANESRVLDSIVELLTPGSSSEIEVVN